jgi:hypothetical protein
MGILDEAIRAHLDLKRRQGAADEELKRLEDEAFGPPTRPGEPDFPDREGEEAEGNGSGASSGEVTTAERESEAAAPPAEPDEASDLVAETEPVGPTTPEEPPPAEPTPVEEPPAQEPPPVEAGADPDAPEVPTTFYDQSEESRLELGDLELEFDEEVAEPGEPAPAEGDAGEEPPIESLDTAEHEPPIESLDTVEHQIDELSDEPVERTPEPPEPSIPSDEAEAGTASGEGGSEDVLEETPEFLRDAPEDDELWFEQGEPKDFDFDD